jgi:hypothetical protein
MYPGWLDDSGSSRRQQETQTPLFQKVVTIWNGRHVPKETLFLQLHEERSQEGNKEVDLQHRD